MLHVLVTLTTGPKAHPKGDGQMSRKSAHMLEHRKLKETSSTEYAFSPETDNFLPGASSDCSESVSEETHTEGTLRLVSRCPSGEAAESYKC